MLESETEWKKNGDWKARYSRLYSSRGSSLQEAQPHRISFLSNDTSQYTTASASLRLRSQQFNRSSTSRRSSEVDPTQLVSLMSQRSALYSSERDSLVLNRNQSDNLGGFDTALLDMVRSRNRELRDQSALRDFILPREDESEMSSEAGVHGLSMRMTERSVSRSRVSRISTRRDMDIPSILAFTTPAAPAPLSLGIPAFQKPQAPQAEDIPRWSIRRSVCPVCSQKWRDRSSIKNIKYSGLKRNLSGELPAVIAPARLRTAITTAYIPRSSLATVDENLATTRSVFRNISTEWHLTRARRFRIPKPQMPSPEAIAPPSITAPTARKDLDNRVHRFLKY